MYGWRQSKQELWGKAFFDAVLTRVKRVNFPDFGWNTKTFWVHSPNDNNARTVTEACRLATETMIIFKKAYTG